jgi:asparagine synthase (glutamine-hydrolysing)
MCGFLAEISFRNQLISKNSFVDILNLSQKRGPDAQGYWSNQFSVQLGFNRLAIVELSEAGNQPMLSHKGKFAIVFNGEIYNHTDLRSRLDFKAFRGNSDTETICACLEEWGVLKTIKALDGMFALTIYNQETKETHLVRDFAGIKPLFYGFDNKTLFASSQYDQILKHPSFVNTSINNQVLKLYLQQHFVPAPFGLYKNTFQVKPGEIITFQENGSKNSKEYWNFSTDTSYLITDEKDALKLIEETLHSCVKDQLMADVPLGAFLSGGVDSPLVCYHAKSLKPDLSTFSIGSNSLVHDESKRAALFAQKLNTNHHEWILNANEVLSHWDNISNALHEPLADISIIPTYLVSNLAKKNVTVALSGDGGDELFLGYERFWSLAKNRHFQTFPMLLKKLIYGTDKVISGNKNINSLVVYNQLSTAHEGLHSRFKNEMIQKIFPDLKEINLPAEWNVYQYENSTNLSNLSRQMQKAEFYGMMQKTLRKVDLASMENSLEVRVPFLQKRMIEASLQIDPLLSFGKNKYKDVLKMKLLNYFPNVEPEKVKKGFTVPLRNWIQTDLKETFSDNLLASTNTFYDKKEVENLLKNHLLGEKDNKWALFTLYSLNRSIKR